MSELNFSECSESETHSFYILVIIVVTKPPVDALLGQLGYLMGVGQLGRSTHIFPWNGSQTFTDTMDSTKTIAVLNT